MTLQRHTIPQGNNNSLSVKLFAPFSTQAKRAKNNSSPVLRRDAPPQHHWRLRACRMILTICLLAGATNISAAPRYNARKWVDSVMKTMTLEEQVAQLIVARVPRNLSDSQAEALAANLADLNVGGVCFFAGTSERQLQTTRTLQSRQRIPLMVCIDAEWGLGMRLADAFSFPRQAFFDTLPAAADTLVYQMGIEIGRQCKMMGIHVNFAPVVDVNSNPNNPIIGTRSFSADPERVARLGTLYMKGLQSQGVMAVAKHFPGHGDTRTDSHKTLPTIQHSCSRLDSVELLPFRRLIGEGVAGVMVAHISVPSYDPTPGLPASLSEPIVNGLLRQDMGFGGLIFTDGLDMGAITQNCDKNGEALAALRAGNDILLIPRDVEASIKVIVEAAKNEPYLRQIIALRCRHVLRNKYRYILPNSDPAQWHTPTSNDSLRCAAILDGAALYQDGRIDKLIERGLDAKAYPGCQVLVLRHGTPIYQRNVGNFTYYPNTCKVDGNTIYDLASLTKVCATTIAVMHLVDEGTIELDKPVSHYLSYLKGTNKENITVREMLSHIARLKAFDNYWQRSNDPDEIRQMMAESPLNAELKYVYSDLGFIFLADAVEETTGLSVAQYMQSYFYDPMGLRNTTFQPLLNDFEADQIAPTEEDSIYRNVLIHGVVHDQNAYALGGVAGHAGLFSTASEVGALMQMLLDGGVYNGKRYLSEAVIDTFNSRYYTSLHCRRALGFDKPFINGNSTHISPLASQSSFGHTGFTGTMLWVDPDYDLVFVFLSNRVHPSAKTNLLAKMNIRTDIQDVIYQVLNQR